MGGTATDHAHTLKSLIIDEAPSNAWSSKCFAYSRSQTLTCAPVTSGSFVRLEYGLYSKVYSRSFAKPLAPTETVTELATLLGKIGSRGLHTLAPCSAPTSVLDLVPSYGVLALNSVYTEGSGESTIDNLVRDLKQANSLLPQDQQCTIKSAKVTVHIMTQKALHHPASIGVQCPCCVQEPDLNSDDEEQSGRLYFRDGELEFEIRNMYGERPGPGDVLVESDQLFYGPGGFAGLNRLGT